jgi:methylated-DNA-[protein]-cysteine S-methyltransferase
MITSWEKKILRSIAYIPKGKVITYKNLARVAGYPRAARAVGNALNKNPRSPKIPCHRVVRSDGKVGGFIYGEKRKEELLRSEGIAISKGKIINMKSIEITNFQN